MNKLFTFFLFIFIQINLFGQLPADCLDHQFIVKLRPQENTRAYIQAHFSPLKQSCIHKGSNLFLFEYDLSNNSSETIAAGLARHPDIITFQKNCRASLRNGNTDDPLSSDQWSLERIGATQLWNVTEGAITSAGDTIAVAVLDSGFDVTQEDLVPNLWSNPYEIDNDGIDNDGNGYIDDVLGLNMQSLTDDHATSFHGTAVAGIIGAKRNNDLGTAGIAGDVKLMIFSEAIFMDRVLRALNYAYDQRKRYNESDGKEGTFVVATNYSLGFDMLKCENFPLFDETYDRLGSAGILSVGATPNRNWNIDDLGDIPSSCGSDFLIAVTNTTEADKKEQAAGFGVKTVDLGAPGEDIITSFPNNDYKVFGGTSGATPHVSAAIALLYSVPCDGFLELVKSDPEKAAREVKRFIFEGTDPIPSLDNLTVTGGRLNVWNAFTQLASEYGATSDKFSIVKLFPNPSAGIFQLELELPKQGFYQTEIFSSDGKLIDFFEIPGFCLDKPYELDLSHLRSGHYFLRIKDGEEMIITSLIIL